MSEEVVEKQPRRNPIFAFFESVFSLVLLMLMIVGLVTVAVKWEHSKVEFVGDDRIRITRTTWWGALEDVSVYRAGVSGWVLERANGEESSVRALPVVLNH